MEECTTKTQTTEYTYNLLNRMTGATITATGEDTQNVSNTYSAQGKRIRKVENGDVSKYYYTGDEVLFTTTGDAFMLTENILEPEGSIIASKRFEYPFDNKYYFYNYDLRSSVTAIVKPDGSKVKDYTYDEFGNLEEGGTQEFLNETTYTGSVKDESTGLQYMNARYYNPESGRFLSQDTYSGNAYEPWTQHLYSYCGNNPTSMVDPTGHFFFTVLGGLFGAVVGGVSAAISGEDILAGAAGGAVSGAMVGAVADIGIATAGVGSALAVGAAVGGLSSATGEGVRQLVAGEEFNGGKIIEQGFVGALLGGGAGRVEKAVIKTILKAVIKVAEKPVSVAKTALETGRTVGKATVRSTLKQGLSNTLQKVDKAIDGMIFFSKSMKKTLTEQSHAAYQKLLSNFSGSFFGGLFSIGLNKK